jgi:hypothetical protein
MIGGFFVAAADPPSGGKGCSFGHSYQFQGQVTVHGGAFHQISKGPNLGD